MRENDELELLYKDSFETLFKRNGDNELKMVATHLYMLKMKESSKK